MTDDKIREVISIYRRKFEEMEIDKRDFPHDDWPDSESTGGLAHCHGMLDKMESFLREGRREKAFRWLGFVQGVLWLGGVYTLEELKNHSRPSV